jgi:phage tail sheath protein FI
MADKFTLNFRPLACFPVYNSDGSRNHTEFAAVDENDSDKAYTYVVYDGDSEVHDVFAWTDERVAVHIASSNSGWGGLTDRERYLAAADVAERVAADLESKGGPRQVEKAAEQREHARLWRLRVADTEVSA